MLEFTVTKSLRVPMDVKSFTMAFYEKMPYP